MNHQSSRTPEEIREERRRQRWNAFWTPFLTLASLVSSVAMLMFLLKTCQERNLPTPILPPSSPLYRPNAEEPDRSPGATSNSAQENQAERTPPAR